MLTPLITAVLSGLLLPLALPNEYLLLGNAWIGFICLAPLFFGLAKCRTPFQAALTGAVFGGISTFLSNYWLMYFKDFAALTIGSVTAAYSLLFIFFGVYLWRFTRFPMIYRPFLIASFWTIYEFVKSTGYLAYPWGLVMYPVHTWLPFLQIADIAGIWPLSFVMALANALTAEFFLVLPSRNFSFFRRQTAFLSILVSFCFLYGLIRMAIPIPVTAVMKTVLVQQNMDPWLEDSKGSSLLKAQALSRKGIANLGGRADLVAWSESSLSRPYQESFSYYSKNPKEDPFVSFVKETGTFLLVGNPIIKNRELRQIQNGAVLLGPDAQIRDTYGKRHPVPIAENVPFWNFKPVRTFFQEVIGLGGIWDLGDRDTIFTIPAEDGKTIRFGVPICFEDAFPYICRRFTAQGADLLVNITNDSWSRQNSAQIQHFVAARFRSIELKRVLIRSTNGGLTSVVGPFGEILAELPMFTPDVLSLEIPVSKESRPTPYALFGDYFPIILSILLTALLFWEEFGAALFSRHGKAKKRPPCRRSFGLLKKISP